MIKVCWMVVKFLLESVWPTFFSGVHGGICKMDIALLHELRCYCVIWEMVMFPL